MNSLCRLLFFTCGLALVTSVMCVDYTPQFRTVECNVCLDEKNDVISLPCHSNHELCVGCARNWFARSDTCPVCRADVGVPVREWLQQRNGAQSQRAPRAHVSPQPQAGRRPASQRRAHPPRQNSQRARSANASRADHGANRMPTARQQELDRRRLERMVGLACFVLAGGVVLWKLFERFCKFPNKPMARRDSGRARSGRAY